jgi:hypothetical protein
MPGGGAGAMAHDVFISYPHQNKAVADAACAKLEAAGIRCWIAPRDIAPSTEWAASIVEAIDQCKVMVLIFSAHANGSRQIHREVQEAFDCEKPVVPFRVEDVLPLGMLRYYMGSLHWLDALTPPLEQHLERLAGSVAAVVSGSAAQPITDITPSMLKPAPLRASLQVPSTPANSGLWLYLKIGALGLLMGMVAGWSISAGFYGWSVAGTYGHLLSADRVLYAAMILLVMVDACSVRQEISRMSLAFILLYLISFLITCAANWISTSSDIVSALGTAARLVVSWMVVATSCWSLKGALEDVRMLAIIAGAAILQGLASAFADETLGQNSDVVSEGFVFCTTAVLLSYGIRRRHLGKPGYAF